MGKSPFPVAVFVLQILFTFLLCFSRIFLAENSMFGGRNWTILNDVEND
jgi:hypothetical protein